MYPLWDRLLVAVIGPIVTAALALGVANVVTARAQNRKDEAETREALATELTRAAEGLYLATQAFWRALRDAGSVKAVPATQREALDKAYRESRLTGLELERRLRVYFTSPTPAAHWHQVTDLLTVRYFTLIYHDDPDRQAKIRKINEGPLHAGLSADQLTDQKLLLDEYRRALEKAFVALWSHKVSRYGRHLRAPLDPAPPHANESVAVEPKRP